MSQLRRYIRLRPEERRLFWRALFSLLAVDVGLRTAGYARVSRWLERDARPLAASGPSADDRETLDTAVWAVAAAARRLPYTVKCMTRSLVLRRLLARRGVAAELVIGVRHRDDGFSAHAWVERDGRPLGEGEDVRERFAALSPSAR